jgi:hypothetical protein
MNALPQLLPYPRELQPGDGTLTIRNTLYIVAARELLFEAQWIQPVLREVSINSEIVLIKPDRTPALVLTIDANADNEQAYTLKIDSEGIEIRGGHPGIFYGLCTLRQLIMQYRRYLPYLSINDYPDFPARGVMLDISRDKVPTMETLYMLVDELAALKINEFQLYIEHTFAYQDHREVWEHASPMTPQEILELDVYCKKRHVDLVPNQNSLGHMERWLKFPRYLPLAETPEGFVMPWNNEFRSASTIDPSDPESLKLIKSLYAEYLPYFSSGLFNIGGDEPWELGQGKNKQAIQERGGRVYLDWITRLHELVQGHGRRMQFWGDIIMKYPELVPEIPENVIALEWGYESTHPFDAHGAVFAKSGVPFYVCPGTSSWNSLIGRTDNAIGNLHNAAENGLKHGAIGYLITDWGDRGHWQPLSVSFLGFAVGVAVSWCYEANKDQDIRPLLDRFIFKDRAGVMGDLVYELGNVYKIVGPDHINGQIMAYALAWGNETLEKHLNAWAERGHQMPDLSPETLRRAIARIDEIVFRLDDSDMERPDADIIKAELRQAAQLAQHGGKRLLLRQGSGDYAPYELEAEANRLLMQQRETWLARNRPGGLDDSIGRFEWMLPEQDTEERV